MTLGFYIKKIRTHLYQGRDLSKISSWYSLKYLMLGHKLQAYNQTLQNNQNMSSSICLEKRHEFVLFVGKGVAGGVQVVIVALILSVMEN